MANSIYVFRFSLLLGFKKKKNQSSRSMLGHQSRETDTPSTPTPKNRSTCAIYPNQKYQNRMAFKLETSSKTVLSHDWHHVAFIKCIVKTNPVQNAIALDFCLFQAISQEQSTKLMKNLIRTGISSVCYLRFALPSEGIEKVHVIGRIHTSYVHRNLLPEECFVEKKMQGRLPT